MAAAVTEYSLQDWQKVPEYVNAVLPVSLLLRDRHNKAASNVGILSIASASWDPKHSTIFVHTPGALSDRIKTAYKNELHADCDIVFTNAAPNTATTILIKKATLAQNIGAGWRNANAALGGPTPLSNAIVSGLVLGGLGYGAGTLAEQLLPDRFLSRGQLRKPLGILGALTGLGYGAVNASTINQYRPDIGYLKSWISSNDTPIIPPQEKMSMFGRPQTNNNLFAPQIPVDAFNRAVWSDARKGYSQLGIVPHTNPAVAAATTSIISGAATQARSPIISPANVINAIASAGVGLATANVAGRTLGALAGLTPAAQEKIQDTGLWAGMLHSVIPPLFGGR